MFIEIEFVDFKIYITLKTQFKISQKLAIKCTMHMQSRPAIQFFAEIKPFYDSSTSQFMSHKIWFIPWMPWNFHWIHKANNLAFVRTVHSFTEAADISCEVFWLWGNFCCWHQLHCVQHVTSKQKLFNGF